MCALLGNFHGITRLASGFPVVVNGALNVLLQDEAPEFSQPVLVPVCVSLCLFLSFSPFLLLVCLPACPFFVCIGVDLLPSLIIRGKQRKLAQKKTKHSMLCVTGVYLRDN